MAENWTNAMHNILKLRDALKWSGYLNQTIDLHGKDVDVKFQGALSALP